ncbi:hypothetical protein Tco_0805561 [Tanacetum coccineum]
MESQSETTQTVSALKLPVLKTDSSKTVLELENYLEQCLAKLPHDSIWGVSMMWEIRNQTVFSDLDIALRGAAKRCKSMLLEVHVVLIGSGKSSIDGGNRMDMIIKGTGFDGREVELKKVRENNDALIIEDWVSDDKDNDESNPKVKKKSVIPTSTQKEFVKPEKQVKRSVSAYKHMVPRAVLMKTGLKYVNTASPVNTVRSVNISRPFSTARFINTVRPSYTAHPKSIIHCARPRTYFKNQAQSTVHMPFYKRTALTKGCFNQSLNTGRPFRSTVNTIRARGFNVVKPSACWVWRPIKPNGASLSNSQLNDKGFVDSGCSRHMTGNIAHLSDFKDFDGGYVTFGGGANGGRITGKGTIKTDKLDFDDVYFVKELKFNLFSVSQMCDKKNYVLFTDSECLVLSPNFKLPDENQILLKIPRQDNMYSFDMKNIVPPKMV